VRAHADHASTGAAKSVQHLLQRGGLVDGQGIQVAFGRFSGHLGAAVQVGDVESRATRRER
jgi:hypothetical protein